MPEFPEEEKKKNDLLIEYAKKGATGGALMALQVGPDVNHKGWDSATALHWAACGGHEALAQGLLGAGADIHAANVAGMTPLHRAAYFNKLEVAKVLLANGAKVNVRTNNGDTALQWAAMRAPPVAPFFGALMAANPRRGSHGGKPEMQALLRQHGTE